MANRNNRFVLKTSNVLNKIPPLSGLTMGEVAVNTAGAKMYSLYSNGNPAPTEVREIGWNRVAITGDTMTGPLFSPTVSATTISATTYLNLPITTDVYVTGGTLSTGGTATFTNTTGGTFNVTGFSTSNNTPIIKSGARAGGTFAGSPRKSTVTFTTNYPNTNYSITVLGEDSRNWTYESKTVSGFVINANAGSAIINDVLWQTINYGEF